MVSTKRVIAGLVATIALAMLGWWLAGQEAQGRCEGILHEDDHAVWIGGEKDEGICIPANSKEVPKITSVCATEGYCVVIGRTEDCKDDTPKCTEINKVSSVTTGKPPRRP